MRILADNDVVLDFLLERKPFYIEAKELLILAGLRKIEIYVAAITPVNAFYTMRKERDQETAFFAVSGLLKLVEVCNTDKSILQNAFTLGFSDYEDAVQHSSAAASGLDAIITRDVKDYKNATLPIFTPVDFLQHLKSQKDQT